LGQYREKIKFVQDQLKKASEYSLKLKVGCPKKKCKVAFHYTLTPTSKHITAHLNVTDSFGVVIQLQT